MALPHNLEAERGLLGAIMVRNDALFDVGQTVTKADFFEPYHGELFTLIKDQVEANRPATPVALMHDITQDRDIGGLSASEYLARLYGDAPDPSLATDLAKAIRDLSLKRRLILAGQEMIRTVEAAPVTLTGDELRARYDNVFGSLFASTADLGIRSLGDIAQEVLTRVGKSMQAETMVGLPVGLKGLQDLIGPLMPGRLYIIGGAPGSGKTALAQQIGEFVAGQGVPVLMDEIEMSGEELAERSLASSSGVPAEKIERAATNVAEYEELHDAVARLKKLPLYVDASTAPSASAIRGKALRMKRLFGVGALIVDHILRMASPDGRLKEHEAIRANLQTLKRTGQDLGIPVILLAPLRKEYANNAIGKEWVVKRPTVDDFYGGSAIEGEADVLMIVHRPEYILRRAEPAENAPDRAAWVAAVDRAAGLAEFILTKRRGGRGYGIRTVNFAGGRTAFSDFDRLAAAQARQEAELPF